MSSFIYSIGGLRLQRRIDEVIGQHLVGIGNGRFQLKSKGIGSMCSVLNKDSLRYALVVLLTLAGGQVNANLIVNGSFEDSTNFVPNSDKYMQLYPGATNMTGWTTINAELAWGRVPNVDSINAADGIFFLDLAGYHNSYPYGGVVQTIQTTPNEQYFLSFDLGAYYAGGTATIRATAGATTQDFSLSTNSFVEWQMEYLNFTATSSTTDITLTGFGADPSYTVLIGLDNVAVESGIAPPVPEPSSFVLLGLGGTGLAVAGYRRRLINTAL